ncbi:hypothetical protein CRENBAI_022238 [Crenichthys baileyi]|uniref:Major facilitator superfamily (MFS) profile domain-containing protein n=1 Tax=Crenichthys baileyi TaxID=28760 RepID=A0AAV9QW29_9TELE
MKREGETTAELSRAPVSSPVNTTEQSKKMRVMYAVYIITALDITWMFLQLSVTPYLAKKLGFDTLWFGYLQTTVGVIQLIGGPVFGRFGDVFGARAALSLACASTSVFFVLLAIADHPFMLFIHKLPTIFMHVLPACQMVVTDLSEPEKRADALSKLGLCFGIGMIAGSTLGGHLSTHYGEKFTACVGAAGSAFSLLLVLSFIPKSTKSEASRSSSKYTGDIVAIMIPEPKGHEIMTLLERRFVVVMHISVGTRNLQKYVSRTSVVFVSISFIVLMIISLAWLVFYYIQRFRYANARDRNQRRLGDAAKKAISKLQVRTLKKGDKFSADCTNETPPDYETSIGGPLTNPISAASDITVNESSVVLDPAGRVIDLHQLHHYQETASHAGQSHPVVSCENQPPMSSDSDTSAIMSVDASMSEADFPLEQERHDAKYRDNPC